MPRRLRAAALIPVVLATLTTPAGATTGRCPQYEPLLARAGLPVATFSRIMWRESRCNPHARSRSHDSGLLQINDIHRRRGGAAAGLTVAQLEQPTTNITVAARLYHRAGLRPWR